MASASLANPAAWSVDELLASIDAAAETLDKGTSYMAQKAVKKYALLNGGATDARPLFTDFAATFKDRVLGVLAEHTVRRYVIALDQVVRDCPGVKERAFAADKVADGLAAVAAVATSVMGLSTKVPRKAKENVQEDTETDDSEMAAVATAAADALRIENAGLKFQILGLEARLSDAKDHSACLASLLKGGRSSSPP